MFAAIAPPEILIPAVIIIVLFGAKKLPEIGKGLGQGIKEFKTATKKAAEEDEAKPEAPDQPAS